MSTVRANTYLDASGGSNAQLFGVASPPNSMGFRNRIINGDMRIDQRNGGAAVTPNDGQYTIDRWQGFRNGGGAYTVQQSTVAPNATFSNSVVLTVTTPDSSIANTDYYAFNQNVEGFNAADLGWGTATAQAIALSFWIRSSVTGTWVVGLCNADGSRAYPATFTVSAANTWQYVTLTVPGETTGAWNKTNGNGLTVRFDLGSGSNNNGTANTWNTAGGFVGVRTSGSVNWIATNGATLFLTGVQLEAGTVASAFDRRDYGRELMLCQRYYQRVGSFYAGTGPTETSLVGAYSLYVPMRTNPASAGFSANFHRPAIAFYTINSVDQVQGAVGDGYTVCTIQAGAGAYTQGQFNGFLNLNAEL